METHLIFYMNNVFLMYTSHLLHVAVWFLVDGYWQRVDGILSLLTIYIHILYSVYCTLTRCAVNLHKAPVY